MEIVHWRLFRYNNYYYSAKLRVEGMLVGKYNYIFMHGLPKDQVGELAPHFCAGLKADNNYYRG